MKLKFWQKSLSFIANRLFPFKMYGKENLIDGAAVIVSNHFSVVDCAHYLNFDKEKPYFLAKKELFKSKFLAWLFGSFGAIPIDRSKPDMKAMVAAMRILRAGEKLVVFPEGTRNRTGTTELQEIKGGAGVFAVRVKLPIIPVMMLKKPRLFRKTKILIGKPFELTEFYDKRLNDEDINLMDDIIREKMIAEQIKLKDMFAKKNGNNKGKA